MKSIYFESSQCLFYVCVTSMIVNAVPTVYSYSQVIVPTIVWQLQQLQLVDVAVFGLIGTLSCRGTFGADITDINRVNESQPPLFLDVVHQQLGTIKWSIDPIANAPMAHQCNGPM